MTPPKVLKIIDFHETPFGHGKTSGDMVERCMPNSGRGGYPGTRVMTSFGSHVGPLTPQRANPY